jgi:N-acetylmuramoyl-L-alanine amidase CwlA
MATKKFTAPAPQFVAARHVGGSQTPRLIVLHSTVSPCKPGGADAIARFFRIGQAVTSAHYVVDPTKVIQMVGDHTIAFHCGYNNDSIGIELCDMPSQDKTRWDDQPHRDMEARAADLVARLCLAYNIPVRYVNAADLRAGKKGITTHAQMSEAFHKSTHWDPGAWRRVRFLTRVRVRVLALRAGRK